MSTVLLMGASGGPLVLRRGERACWGSLLSGDWGQLARDAWDVLDPSALTDSSGGPEPYGEEGYPEGTSTRTSYWPPGGRAVRPATESTWPLRAVLGTFLAIEGWG